MPSDNNQEMFPVVDEQGNITGAATRGAVSYTHLTLPTNSLV